MADGRATSNRAGCQAAALRMMRDRAMSSRPAEQWVAPALGIGRVAAELYGDDWQAPFLALIGEAQHEMALRYDEARRVYYERLEAGDE